MKSHTLFLFTILFSALAGQVSQANMDCPRAIRVQVAGLASTSASNQRAIDKIYALGQQQTEKSFIVAALQSVNQFQALEDVLTYSVKYSDSNTCFYKGENSSLAIEPEYDVTGRGKTLYTAKLNLGFVNYKSGTVGGNPISVRGYAANLVTYLNSVRSTGISEDQSRASFLYLDMFVQIPMDYGTDGYEEQAKIGQARSVSYSVIR